MSSENSEQNGGKESQESLRIRRITAVCTVITCAVAVINLIVSVVTQHATAATQAQQQAATANTYRIEVLNNQLAAVEEYVTQIEDCHESYTSGELTDEQRSSISSIYNSVSMKIDKDNGNAYADDLEDTMSSYLVEMGAKQGEGGLPVAGSLPDLEALFNQYRAAERDIIQEFADGTR